MRILTIDWDFFFPSPIGYDWGHGESPLLVDLIWPLRCDHVHMSSGKEVLEHYLPDVPEGFWNIVTNRSKLPVIVGDSHAYIWYIIREIDPLEDGFVELTNIDAHHDCGYHNDDDENVRCSNWAGVSKMVGYVEYYRLFYPEWRKEEKEGFDESLSFDHRPEEVEMGILPPPQDYDVVYVCRSGAWTPPWCDGDFRAWIESAGFKEVQTPYDEIMTTSRPPATMEEAKKVRDDFRKMRPIAGNTNFLEVPSSQFMNVKQEKKV